MTNFIIIYIYIFKIFVGLQTFQDFFFEFLPFTYSKTKLTIPIKNRPSAGDLQWLRLGPPSFLLETFPKKTGGGGVNPPTCGDWEKPSKVEPAEFPGAVVKNG